MKRLFPLSIAAKVLRRNGAILLASLFGLSLIVTPVDGKRRASAPPPLQILHVTPSPSPFDLANGDLHISVSVAFPATLRGKIILEVTSLITYPTQRSMRFLSQRTPIPVISDSHRKKRIDATLVLVWDGTDQYKEKVSPGTYHYEVRAKLLKPHGNDLLTLWLSRQIRGTVEVIHSDTLQADSPATMLKEPAHETTNPVSHHDQAPGLNVGKSQGENATSVENESPIPGHRADNPTGEVNAPQED